MVQSDNGREFKNSTMKSMLEGLGIKMVHGAP